MSRHLPILILVLLTGCATAPMQDIAVTPIPTIEPSRTSVIASTLMPGGVASPTFEATESAEPTIIPTKMEAPTLTAPIVELSGYIPPFYQRLDLARDYYEFSVADVSQDGQWLLLEGEYSLNIDAALDLLNLSTGKRITIMEEALTYHSVISDDGSAVAFIQYLTPGTGDCPEYNYELCRRLYHYDTNTGTITGYPLDTIKSVYSQVSLVISGDGRYIAYVNDYLERDPDDEHWGLRLLDTTTGSIDLLREDISDVTVSHDGSIISYVRMFPNEGAFPTFDVFRLDRSSGITTRVTTFESISYSPNYTWDYLETFHRMSGDGRFILFSSNLPGIVDYDLPLLFEDGTTTRHIYLYDHVTGSIELIDVTYKGAPTTLYGSYIVDFSADARYVLFRSQAADIVSTPVLQAESLYIRDRQRGQTAYIPAKGYTYALLGGEFIILGIQEHFSGPFYYYRIPIADLFAMP